MEQNTYPSGAERAGRKLVAWLMVMLVAAVLSLGMAPGTALAEDDTSAESDDTITVALTIVDTTDSENGVIYNAAVSGLTEEDTVADLLAAAGFTEVSTAEETLASDSYYYSSWGSPTFRGNVTSTDDAGNWTYWCTMYDGDSANYASASLTANLQDGGHYQYIYGSESTFTYDEDAFTVQLTIVDTTDSENGVIYNAAVSGLTEEDTVADLLAAAGFTEVSTAEETLASDSYYYSSWGSPTFRGNVTSTDDAGNWTYWCTMYDGDSANYASASLTSTLVDGGHYQYIYGSESTYSYSDDVPDLITTAVLDPLADYEADTEDDSAEDETDTDTDADTETETEPAVNIYDEDKTATLLENLIERFSDGGSDEAISNGTAYAAIALNSLGLGDQIDADAIIESLESYEETYGSSISAGTLAKYIMALTAAGVDCTDVEVTLGDETVTDLVAYMEDLVTGSENAYSAVFILAIYDYGGYETENSDEIIDEMITAILENTSDGLAGGSGYYDTETTAQAILALLPYADDADVAAFLEEAEAALLSYQNEDGGFGYASYSTDSNLDATAYIVAALTALGYDCAEGTALTTENGSTPIGYLVAMADSTLDGYLDNSSYDESMTSATVLLALAAWKGEQATSFNVYEAQDVASSEGGDATEAAASEEAAEEETSEDSLVQTGDHSLTAAMVLAAAGMLAAGAGVTRRRRALADGIEDGSDRRHARRHTTDRR